MSIEQKIKAVLANPLTSDEQISPEKELEDVLSYVGLSIGDVGGKVSFHGKDPVISSPWPLATMAGVALAAKSVAVADIWKERTGEGQDIHVDLRKVLHRLCPFYDRKWELLNGYPPGMPSDPSNPFMPSFMYQTRDNRWIQLLNIYPKTKHNALKFFGCNDDKDAIQEQVRKWDGEALETELNRLGLQATLVRTVEEFIETEQFQYLRDMPLVEITRIGDCDPIPFKENPQTPLDGVRALGLGRVIAGAGLGRALSYHGADVLNIWGPNDYEMDLVYSSSSVGMRSCTLDLKGEAEQKKFNELLKDADVFFSNRRPGFLARYGLTAEELAAVVPGLIHVDMSLYGWEGPWAHRVGYDQNAGGVTGVFAREGTPQKPQLTEIFVVNDYVMSWIAEMATLVALKRRAREGGSYRVRVSLARLSIWLLQMGIFDKDYSCSTAGTRGDHEYLDPDLFRAETPSGFYQGVTDQVEMSRTPGAYRFPLMPRGSCKAEWLED